MPDLIHYNHCPVCNSIDIINLFSVRDYTVTGESFIIAECKSCTFRFTQDVPGVVSISPYYKSEEYISHTNTSKGLINNLYQTVRKRTLKQKRKLIEKITGSIKGNLLDVGSGIGAFANEMIRAGWQVTGLEPDSAARTVGKDLYNIDLADIKQFYQLQDGAFEAITLWHVLEHVHDLQGYVSKLKSLLKEKGKLFIAVPNYTSKDAAFYQEHWAAYDVPRHLYHFSPHSMQVLMKKHGLKIEAYKPMWYDSFYVSMLSSKYRHGKTNLVGAFFEGLVSNMKAIGNVKRCSSVVYIIGK
jgi:2-polyprenyl-3-methyl-5-hydroxy-6-metoxy-1,4-benzoquinol methylase